MSPPAVPLSLLLAGVVACQASGSIGDASAGDAEQPGADVDPCSGVSCTGHGTCVVAGTNATCDCEGGYHASGLECLADDNPCAGVTCSGHGTCVVAGTNATCDCEGGYHASGLECLADDNPCAGVTCSGHGTCVVAGTSATCECETGFVPSGLSCFAGCTPNPCVSPYRTVCVPAEGAARCNCDPNYFLQGDTCVPAGTGLCGANDGQLFPAAAPWNSAIDNAPLDSESAAIIGYLSTNYASGAGLMEIAFDFNILYADDTVAHRSFTPTGSFYSPDCDPAPVPVPPGGRLEGMPDYACDGDADCHLTVIDVPACRLYEMWQANLAGGEYDGSFSGGCLAIWDLSAVPPPTERGDYCTSADAAGLPVLPLVFTPDEVASGNIEHALRFVIPNEHIRDDVFVRPGTHSTPSTSGPATAPPYASRLRLKASTDISGLSEGAQVIARALKKYGMILADGGRWTFTASTDELTTHTWSSVGVGGGSLASLTWDDFEVVELGARITWSTGDCNRTPIAE